MCNRSNPSNPSYMTELNDQQRWARYSRWLDHADPAIRANAPICLIHQANYLLDQQILALEAQFIGEGGYSEMLATARLEERSRQKSSGIKQPALSGEIPACPQCGKARDPAHRDARQEHKPILLGLHPIPRLQGRGAGVTLTPLPPASVPVRPC